MNTIHQTSENSGHHLSRRSFLRQLFVSGVVVSLIGCGKSNFPEGDQVNIKVERGEDDFILKDSLFRRLENIQDYFLINKDYEIIDGIKTVEIKDSENTLTIQIGNGFLMGEDCLLIKGSVDGINMDIVYKNGIVKSQKGNLNYVDLAYMIGTIEPHIKF